MTHPRSLLEVVRAALLDLDGVGAAHALVGGLAIGVHGLPRATRDADFALAVDDDAHAERVIADLRARGYGLGTVLEQTETNRLSTARLTSPLDARTMIDVLFASSGIESEIVAAANVTEIGGGIACPVARRGHLVALKTLSRSDTRPQDDQDLGALLTGIDEAELIRARDALGLIAARGFARGKDLAAELEAQLARWR